MTPLTSVRRNELCRVFLEITLRAHRQRDSPELLTLRKKSSFHMHQFGTAFPTLLRFRQSRQLVEEFFYMGREFFRLRHVPALPRIRKGCCAIRRTTATRKGGVAQRPGERSTPHRLKEDCRAGVSCPTGPVLSRLNPTVDGGMLSVQYCSLCTVSHLSQGRLTWFTEFLCGLFNSAQHSTRDSG